MTTTDILLIIVWTLIIIEIIIILIPILKTRQLNHIPHHNYPFEEVCFEINNIRYVTYNIAEYTAIVCFFKKSNNKHFVYNKYRFYDIKDKYNVGDKLYLNKKQ